MHLLREGGCSLGERKPETTHRSLEEQVFGETGMFLSFR